MVQQQFQLANCTAGQQNPCSGGSEGLEFSFRRLAGGRSEGVGELTLVCGDKSVVVLPTRGMGIWQARHRNVRFGWDSPVQGPVHPNWVPLSEPGGLGWLDGFDELLTRCGLSSNGAPEFEENGTLKWPLHGRVANLPANDVVVSIDEQAGTISVSGTVLETRFHFYSWQLETTITLQLDSDEISVVDRVTNLSDRTGSFQLLYHCNFGPPVLEAGAKFYAPVSDVTPRNPHSQKGIEHWDEYAGADADYCEEVYFLKLMADENQQALTLVANADRSLGATVRYPVQNLPCFTLWKNTVGMADGFVTGLEPGTNLPNTRSEEEQSGRVVEMQSGESVEFGLAIGMLVDTDAVASAIEQIASIRRV